MVVFAGFPGALLFSVVEYLLGWAGLKRKYPQGNPRMAYEVGRVSWFSGVLEGKVKALAQFFFNSVQYEYLLSISSAFLSSLLCFLFLLHDIYHEGTTEENGWLFD